MKTRGHVIETSAAWLKKQIKLPAVGISTKNA